MNLFTADTEPDTVSTHGCAGHGLSLQIQNQTNPLELHTPGARRFAEQGHGFLPTYGHLTVDVHSHRNRAAMACFLHSGFPLKNCRRLGGLALAGTSGDLVHTLAFPFVLVLVLAHAPVHTRVYVQAVARTLGLALVDAVTCSGTPPTRAAWPDLHDSSRFLGLRGRRRR